MFWLALAAVVIGTGLQVAGAIIEGQQEADVKELEAQRLREEALLLEEGKKVQQAEIELRQKVLSEQALEISYQGRAVRGIMAAQAGAGSLGGASPLRQAMAVQRKTETRLDITRRQSEFTTLAGEAGMRQTEFDIRWAGLGAEQKEKEAEWAEQYGWLSAFGYGLTGMGETAGMLGERYDW